MSIWGQDSTKLGMHEDAPHSFSMQRVKQLIDRCGRFCNTPFLRPLPDCLCNAVTLAAQVLKSSL